MFADKPIIALNADYRSSTKDAPAFSYVAAGYYDAILKAGALPLILPPVPEDEDLSRLLDVLPPGLTSTLPRRLHAASLAAPARQPPRDLRPPPGVHGGRPPDAGVRHRRWHAVAQRHARGQPVAAHRRGHAQGLAAPRPDGPGPSPRTRSRRRLAHGAGLWRRRDSREQHAPHGRRRVGPWLPRDCPLSRRRGRSDRGRAPTTGSRSAPSSTPKPTPPRPSICGSSKNSWPASAKRPAGNCAWRPKRPAILISSARSSSAIRMGTGAALKRESRASSPTGGDSRDLGFARSAWCCPSRGAVALGGRSLQSAGPRPTGCPVRCKSPEIIPASFAAGKSSGMIS